MGMDRAKLMRAVSCRWDPEMRDRFTYMWVGWCCIIR